MAMTIWLLVVKVAAETEIALRTCRDLSRGLYRRTNWLRARKPVLPVLGGGAAVAQWCGFIASPPSNPTWSFQHHGHILLPLGRGEGNRIGFLYVATLFTSAMDW